MTADRIVEMTVPPIVKEIRVAAGLERAFKVFTRDVVRWWSPTCTVNPAGAAVAEILIEPHVGGRWFERGVDGSEATWGTVLAFEPPRLLRIEWLAGAGRPSEVEVRFRALAPALTEVRLEHRVDRLGADAAEWRGRYDGGWGTMLARYVAEAGAAADAVGLAGR